MRRTLAALLAAGLLFAGSLGAMAGPAQAATPLRWKVTALYSQPGWTTARPSAPVLAACLAGTNVPLAMGSPVTVKAAMTYELLAAATVTRVTVRQQGGRWVCQFMARVPVAPNSSNLFRVQVGGTPPRIIGRAQLLAQGWQVTFRL
jgi:hypothetical protein